VWLGGPVAQDGFVFVFRAAEHPLVALPMGDDCYLSGDGTLFARVIGEPDERAHRFFMGFAQWAEGQLDAEIARGDWWVLPMDTRVLFDTSTSDLWRVLIERVRNPSAMRPDAPAGPRRVHRVTPQALPSPASGG
jgi:putative transcriptional regulator